MKKMAHRPLQSFLIDKASIGYFIIFFLLLTAISHNSFKTFAYLYAPQLEIFFQITHIADWKGGNLWSIAKHLLDGTPRPDLPMYTWANRQLAPRIINTISATGISYREAAIVFIWLGILIQNYLLAALLIKSKNTLPKTLALVICYNYLFVTFHDRTGLGWFYVWDVLSIIIFTIFAFLVVTEKPLKYFIILFFIALLNREDAIFIALYILISSVAIKFSTRSVVMLSRSNFLVGLLLMAIGFIYTKLARNYFSFTEPPPSFGNTFNPLFDAVYNLFIRNFSFINDSLFFNAIDGFWLISTSTLIILIFNRLSKVLKDLCITYICFVFSILIMGNNLTNEVRLYLPLFPLFIFIVSKLDSVILPKVSRS